MRDYKLKVILALLSGIVFSMIFIILALVVPVKDAPKDFTRAKPETHLEKISHSMKNEP
jgi:hypothetical protein